MGELVQLPIRECSAVAFVDMAPRTEGGELVPIGDGDLFMLKCSANRPHHELDPCIDVMGIVFWPSDGRLAAERRAHPAYVPDTHEGVIDWDGVTVFDIRQILWDG